MSSQGPEWDPPPRPTGPPAAPPSPPSYPYPDGYATAQTEGTAIAALVLATLSFVLMPFIAIFSVSLAIIGLILAKSSRKRIAKSRGRLTGDGFNRAAVIIAWVNIGLAIVVLGVIVMLIGS